MVKGRAAVKVVGATRCMPSVRRLAEPPVRGVPAAQIQEIDGMTELKTKPTDADVGAYLAGVTPERKRLDSLVILQLMRRVTGELPVMWGPNIIGFGRYRYAYDSGRTGEWFTTGFAPRKQNLVLYIMPGFREYADLMGQLGKHKTGRSCLYINKLSDVDLAVLEKLVAAGHKHMQKIYPDNDAAQ